MIQKKIVILLYLLQYYHYLAFYIPSTLLHKNKHSRLSNYNNDDLENNDLDVDSTSKSFNKNLRLGRSKDQDGKSNIWSVEPKMEVIDEEITEVNKNILTGGLFFTGVLASLPILYTLSKYIQNIDY